MKINLNLLPVNIDTVVTFPKDFYENTSITDLKEVKVTGTIKYNASDEIAIDLAVQGTMVLKDSITNDPVDYPLDFEITEILENLEGESEKYFEKKQNILDIIEFLWENIVLEVPISFTNVKDTHLKGDGWELNNNESEDEIDPRMEKLSEIFKGGE